MKILILNHEYPPVGGGGGQACMDIAQGLAKRGHGITVITAHLKSLPWEEVNKKIRIIRVPSFRKLPYRVGFVSMAVFILTATWKGIQIIREGKPSIIHVHFAVPAGVAAFILKTLTGIPYILTSHLGDVPGGVPDKTDKWFRWVFPFTRPVWKNATRVVTVSQFTSSLIQKHYGIMPLIIPNGIDTKYIGQERLQNHTPPRIIFVGRFTKQKNIIELVEIMNLLQDLPWNCILLGDGPLRDQIEQKIVELDLKERFLLPGWVAAEEVEKYLSSSDLLFMPSHSEGLSEVGIHGLLNGLAIVAYRVGGFGEMVKQNQNGFLAEPGDRGALQSALHEYLSDEKRLLEAREASRKIAVRFDLNAVVDQYESILNQFAKKSTS
jgi:glycosyltransferase involved in cell wall biosynthesis